MLAPAAPNIRNAMQIIFNNNYVTFIDTSIDRVASHHGSRATEFVLGGFSYCLIVTILKRFVVHGFASGLIAIILMHIHFCYIPVCACSHMYK